MPVATATAVAAPLSTLVPRRTSASPSVNPSGRVASEAYTPATSSAAASTRA
ncbi:MAG: hypothetical protein MUF34_13160 [Polyangiaceae bacterium]|nr:hypothetical protein [Polyangiaceae bacterium]